MPHPSEKVHRIEFEIPWPPHSAYAYLLPAEEPILVDAGAPSEEGWTALCEGLASAGYEPADVEHLLITHPHTDHGGQASALIDAADPTVYAPTGVRERLDRDAADLSDVVRHNAAEAGVPEPETAVGEAVDSLRRNRECLPPEEIDVSVAPNERFSVGDVSFEAVHAPGHQIDQMAFRTGGSLFAGDALVEPFRPAALHVGFDRGYRDCVDAFYEALDRLSRIDTERVYPGHGPVFEDAAGAIGRARDDLDDLVAECRRTLADLGRASAYEVTDTRVDDPRRMQFSTFDSVGALTRLERRDEAESRLENGVRTYRL